MLKELRRIFRKIPYNLRLFLAVILLGIVSGLSGIFLHHLLEIVESLAFGHSEHQTGFDRWGFLLTDRIKFNNCGYQLILGLVFLAKRVEDLFHQSSDEG